MKSVFTAASGLTAAALLSAGLIAGGMGTAAAAPGDYTALLIDPNVVTDSQAWSSGAPTVNPNGQPGVTAVFTHRDGSRTITDTVLVLPDPNSATAANATARDDNTITNPTSQSVAVGTDGQLTTGTTPDGRSVGVLTFTQGRAATTIEFEGAANDPVPVDLVEQLGQAQLAQITSQLGS